MGTSLAVINDFFKMKFYDFLVIISLNLLDRGILKKTLH